MSARKRRQKLKRKVQSFGPSKVFLARARRTGDSSSQSRVPELRALADKSVALFGLGCIGAPSALEFARAGVRRLTLIDYDEVDPGTTVRWPRGLAVAGLPKTAVIADSIREDYPYTDVAAIDYRIGAVRRPDRRSSEFGPHESEPLSKALDGASLVYDATAELGIQHFLSEEARERGIPYVGIAGTYGAWGGKVFRFPSKGGGCWWCYRCLCETDPGIEPSSDESDSGKVQPHGCADPTFTGSNFDMMHVVLAGVRTAVSMLSAGVDGGYPDIPWDALHIDLRNAQGQPIAARYREIKVPVHPKCLSCNGGNG